MTFTKDNTTGVLKLSGTLDIDAANSLRETLLDCFLQQQEVATDLSAVDTCDTASLQVLLAAQRNAASFGKAFRITAASSSVTETAAALGLPLNESADVSEKRHPHAN